MRTAFPAACAVTGDVSRTDTLAALVQRASDAAGPLTILINNVVAYSAAKAAYGGMVRSLASEFGPHGVRVNAIAPGWIGSEMLDQALNGDPARRARILARTPLARFGDAEDIGWAAVYLCSPAGKFVNGVVLPVDGGAAIGF
jgi:gluconate 5-dehydrogenase